MLCGRDLTIPGCWYSQGSWNNAPLGHPGHPETTALPPAQGHGLHPLPGLLIRRESGPEGRLHPSCFGSPVQNPGKRAPADSAPAGPPGGVSSSRRVAGWSLAGRWLAAWRGLWPAASRAPSEAADRLAAGQVAATCGAACRGRAGGRAQRREVWGRAGGPPIPHAGPFIKFAGLAGQDSLGFLIANSLRSLHLICMEITSWPQTEKLPLPSAPSALLSAHPQSGRGEGHSSPCALACASPPQPPGEERGAGLAEHPPRWQPWLCPR